MVSSSENIAYIFQRQICHMVYNIYGKLSCRDDFFRSFCSFYIIRGDAVTRCDRRNYSFRNGFRRFNPAYHSRKERARIVDGYFLSLVEHGFVCAELLYNSFYLTDIALCVFRNICQYLV